MFVHLMQTVTRSGCAKRKYSYFTDSEFFKRLKVVNFLVSHFRFTILTLKLNSFFPGEKNSPSIK